MAIGADRGDPARDRRRGVGRAGDRRGDRRGDRADGDRFDLILFGNESADAGNFQVGDPRRARARAAGRDRA